MKKIIICIDGLGKDCINEKDSPFLFKFGKENSFCELETLFAFTEEYSFFSGKTPAEHGKWLEYQKSDNSVFDNFFLKMASFNNQLRNYVGILIQYLNGRRWLIGTHNIPSDKLKYFDSSLKKGLWELDFFKGKRFVVYKWPFIVVDGGKEKIIPFYEADSKRLSRLLRFKRKEIYYTQLMEIDKIAHKFGKESQQFKEILRKIDNELQKVVENVEDSEIIIWSDHGFADVKKYIDIAKILPKKKDYVCFIAGTTTHFWTKNKSLKKEIISKCKGVKEIKFLTKEKIKKFKAPMSNQYGDFVLYVEKGNYFFPNFYQKKPNEKFKGMHGYPEDCELNGFLISNKRISKKIKMEKVVKFL